MAVYLTVFANRSNTKLIRLMSGGLPQDLTSLTRVTLEVDGAIIDSDLHPGAFDWTSNPTEGEMKLNLGSFLINHTDGFVPAEFVVYDPVYGNGLVFSGPCSSPNFYIHVCD